MLRPRWRKVIRDLWGNKIRTILVVLSIAIGVFSIGMIISTQILLKEELAVSYSATNPASFILYTDPFDAELLDTIRRLDGVREAEARRSLTLPLQVAPDEWKSMNVAVIPDYREMQIHLINPVSGAWPPPRRALVVERASLPYMGAELGDSVTVEAPDGSFLKLELAGLAHDIFTNPVQFTGQPNAYLNVDTMEWLGYPRTFDEMLLVVDGDSTDEAHVQAVADLVRTKVEKGGLTVYYTYLPKPGEHPANDVVQPLLLILGAMGLASLGASAFLVVNIINALLAQHTQQIGIMKAVGARRAQIVQMYLVSVMLLGLFSLIIAMPLSALAAYGLTGYLASLINFDLAGLRVPPRAAVVELTVAIIVPLVAALVPVIRGSSITVREALSEQGLGKGQFGTHLLDRLVEWITGRLLALSRPMRISLRNTIRRKARLMLTLFTLILGGAIFIGVLSVRASLLSTLDDALAYFNYDADLNFGRAYRIAEIEREASKVPGVKEVQCWITASARRLRPDGQESESFALFGTDPQSSFIQPILLEGRWLSPQDENSIVLNSLVLKEEPDVHVGDWIDLTLEDRETHWQVVGIVQAVLTGGIGYVNQPYLARSLNFVGRSGWLLVIADQHDGAFQRDLARRLKDHFDSVGMQVSATGTTAEIRELIEYQFNIIVILLAVMAVLIAMVGGLGLTGTMSINVLERTREIGVMRAVGASDGSVLRIVLVEGMVVGVLSWIVGGLAAYPMGLLLSNIVGVSLLESPLDYRFATAGAFGWLAAVLVIAALASLLPAWNASRLSVRQTLAYE